MWGFLNGYGYMATISYNVGMYTSRWPGVGNMMPFWLHCTNWRYGFPSYYYGACLLDLDDV